MDLNRKVARAWAAKELCSKFWEEGIPAPAQPAPVLEASSHQCGHEGVERKDPEPQAGRARLSELRELPNAQPVLLRKARSLPTIFLEETETPGAVLLIPLKSSKKRFLLLLNGETAACRLNPAALCRRPPDRHQLGSENPLKRQNSSREAGPQTKRPATSATQFTLPLAWSEAPPRESILNNSASSSESMGELIGFGEAS